MGLVCNKTLILSLLTFFLVVLTGCGGGDSTTGAGGAGDPALLGTWYVDSRNGLPVRGATLTFSASTYRFEGPDCIETGTYTVSDGTLTGTVSSVTGTGAGCEEPPGQIWMRPYTVTTITHAHPATHSHPALVLKGENTSVWIKI